MLTKEAHQWAFYEVVKIEFKSPLSHKTSHKTVLLRKVRQTIDEHLMLAAGARVLIGVSGGSDSVALLHLLGSVCREKGCQIGIAHVNHGLRGNAADRDAAFVEALAKSRGVPYYVKCIDLFAIRKATGGSLEEAGRDARYAFFDETANRHGYERIAVGHHADDDAELILMNLLRGSGPTGMAGIAPVRGRIVRPLIHCRREELRLFLEAEKITFVHDKTNDNTRFQRNHVRHRLIPALEHYNPRVVETLHRLGRIAGAEDRWIEALIAPVFDAAANYCSEGRLVLDIAKITAQPLAVRRRIARKAVYAVKGNLRRIGFGHIDAVLSLMDKADPSGRLDLPDRIRVTRRGGSLIVKAADQSLRALSPVDDRSASRAFEYGVDETRAAAGVVDIPESGARIFLTRIPVEDMDGFPSGESAVFDWDRLEFPLYIRSVRPGDRFMPLGMARTQKLKNFFINNKVPADQRKRIPLVTSRDKVIWIAGMRMDERFKVTRQTKTVLRAQWVTTS